MLSAPFSLNNHAGINESRDVMAGHRLQRVIRLTSCFPPVPRDALAPVGVRAYSSVSQKRLIPAVSGPTDPTGPINLTDTTSPTGAALLSSASSVRTPSVRPPCACLTLTQPNGCYTVATVGLLSVGGGRHGISRLAGRRLSFHAEPVRRPCDGSQNP